MDTNELTEALAALDDTSLVMVVQDALNVRGTDNVGRAGIDGYVLDTEDGEVEITFSPWE